MAAVLKLDQDLSSVIQPRLQESHAGFGANQDASHSFPAVRESRGRHAVAFDA
jgi:hypothetical protein